MIYKLRKTKTKLNYSRGNEKNNQNLSSLVVTHFFSQYSSNYGYNNRNPCSHSFSYLHYTSLPLTNIKINKKTKMGRALTSIYTRLKVSSMFPHVMFAITKSGRIGSDKALSIASSTASCNKNTHTLNYTKASSFIITIYNSPLPTYQNQNFT